MNVDMAAQEYPHNGTNRKFSDTFRQAGNQ